MCTLHGKPVDSWLGSASTVMEEYFPLGRTTVLPETMPQVRDKEDENQVICYVGTDSRVVRSQVRFVCCKISPSNVDVIEEGSLVAHGGMYGPGFWEDAGESNKSHRANATTSDSICALIWQRDVLRHQFMRPMGSA